MHSEKNFLYFMSESTGNDLRRNDSRLFGSGFITYVTYKNPLSSSRAYTKASSPSCLSEYRDSETSAVGHGKPLNITEFSKIASDLIFNINF